MDPDALITRYISLWNTADPAARRAIIGTLWAPDGRHYMGAHDVQGHDAMEVRAAGSYQRSIVEGANVFRLAGPAQALPGVVKFRWDMARRDGGLVVATGVGVLILAPDGRIATDYQFVES